MVINLIFLKKNINFKIKFSEDYLLQVTESKFINNRALCGGVVYINSVLPYFSEDNYYKDNFASYGNVFASYAIRIGLTIYSQNDKENKIIFNSLQKNSSLYILKDEYPGMFMKKVLRFQALDHFNQTVTTKNSGLINIKE